MPAATVFTFTWMSGFFWFQRSTTLSMPGTHVEKVRLTFPPLGSHELDEPLPPLELSSLDDPHAERARARIAADEAATRDRRGVRMRFMPFS